MISKNKTFMETMTDISNNIKKCGKSVMNCCKNSYQKMHFELTKTRLHKNNRYRNLNSDYSNVYYDEKEEEYMDECSLEHIYGSDNLKLYSGYHNIWFSLSKVQYFNNTISPNHNTINIIKPRMGYCIISRSCKKNNILAKFCYNLEGYRLTNKSKLKVGDIVFCRYSDWRYHCLGVIKKLRQDYNKDLVFDLVFSCCPDSELFLAWHFNNSIEQNRTLLKYKLPNENLKDNGDIKYKTSLETIKEENTSCAAFICQEDIEDTEIEKNEILGSNKYMENKSDEYSCPFFSKKTFNNNEIIKYNTFWVNENKYNKKLFKRKEIIVSSRENVTNIFTECLSNVKVISDFHMKNILNIHQRKHDSLKLIKTVSQNLNMNMLEPQELSFFIQNNNFVRISNAIKGGLLCTYTGKLCNKAKQYLLINCH